MVLKSAILFVVVATIAVGQIFDYCDTNLCPDGFEHIGCNNTGNLSDACLEGCQIMDLSSYITIIVNEHNRIRNTTASGKDIEYAPASRMKIMHYDEDLAYYAQMNVNQCILQHDLCRSTEKYPQSGQNLAWYWTNGLFKMEDVLIDRIWHWEIEKYNTTINDILEFQITNQTIGHYTLIVQENNTAVGCGAVVCPNYGGKEIYFGCNYGYNNIWYEPVYTIGKTASKCKKRHSKYKNLCE